MFLCGWGEEGGEVFLCCWGEEGVMGSCVVG